MCCVDCSQAYVYIILFRVGYWGSFVNFDAFLLVEFLQICEVGIVILFSGSKVHRKIGINRKIEAWLFDLIYLSLFYNIVFSIIIRINIQQFMTEDKSF